MWFYVQSTMKIVDILARLVTEAGNRKGGALLNVIYRVMLVSSD